MSIQCCVPGCSSTDNIKSLFGFPRHDLNLLDEWINEIPNLDINQLDLDFSCVCEDHFKPEEVIIRYHDIKELVAGAIPSKFPRLKINLEACRFCLKIKNVGDRLNIDESVKSHFECLMGVMFQEDPFMPVLTACTSCYADIRKSSLVKQRVEKSQKLLMELFEDETKQHIKQELPDFTSHFMDEDEHDTFEHIETKIEVKEENVSNTSQTKSDRKKKNSKSKKSETKSKDKKTSQPKTAKRKSALTEVEKQPCPKCNKYFSQNSLQTHLKTFHLEDIKGAECHLCTKKYSTQHNLNKHLLNDHNISPVKEEISREKCAACSICGKVMRKTSIKCHKNQFHPDAPEDSANVKARRERVPAVSHRQKKVPCKFCEEMIPRSKLIKHQIKEHNLKPEFVCDICGTARYEKTKLYSHMRNHMTEITRKCPHCDLVLNKKDFMPHVHDMHFNKMHVCEFCGLPFASLQACTTHIRSMHNSQRKCFECEQNGKVSLFPTREALIQHQYEAHTTCLQCGAKFCNPNSLQRHCKLKHLEKPFICTFPDCGKKYGLASLLKDHMDIHRGAKNYQCPFCPTHTYYKKNYLDRHIKASHMRIKIPCEVPGCKSSFPRKDSLRFHILNQHKELDSVFVQSLLENIRDMKLPKTRDFFKDLQNP